MRRAPAPFVVLNYVAAACHRSWARGRAPRPMEEAAASLRGSGERRGGRVSLWMASEFALSLATETKRGRLSGNGKVLEGVPSSQKPSAWRGGGGGGQDAGCSGNLGSRSPGDRGLSDASPPTAFMCVTLLEVWGLRTRSPTGQARTLCPSLRLGPPCRVERQGSPSPRGPGCLSVSGTGVRVRMRVDPALSASCGLHGPCEVIL